MLPSGISCGAYSVTQGAVSSISPHNHCHNHGQDKVVRDGHQARDSNIARVGHLTRNGHLNNMAEDSRQLPPPPDLSELSYYRYN